MRFVLTLAGILAAAGCVAAPPERITSHTAVSPGASEGASQLGARIERAAFVEEDAAETIAAAAPQTSSSGWARPSRKELLKTIDRQKQEIDRLKGDYKTAAEGFQFVTLEWIKAALFYRGYYTDIAVPPGGVDDLVFSYLGDSTIRASQRFQCDFHRKIPGDLCDPRSQTGWLTFIEARDLICRGAYEFTLPTTTRPKADPDLTLLVAEWYMKGNVYKQSPRIAYFLLTKLLENITYRFENSNDPSERARLAKFQRRALDAMDFIAAMPKISVKDIPNYTVSEVCPRTL